MSASSANSHEPHVSEEPELSIAKRIKAARESVSYSLDDLALTCGLTHAELSDIERGADLDEGKLKRVAAALRIPAAALLADVR